MLSTYCFAYTLVSSGLICQAQQDEKDVLKTLSSPVCPSSLIIVVADCRRRGLSLSRTVDERPYERSGRSPSGWNVFPVKSRRNRPVGGAHFENPVGKAHFENIVK